VVADPELMDRVFTGDESWFYPHDPETKLQSLEWQSRPKKARMSQSKVKCTLGSFCDPMGKGHKEWLPVKETVSITKQKFFRD
jgi:hypothetical protein